MANSRQETSLAVAQPAAEDKENFDRYPFVALSYTDHSKQIDNARDPLLQKNAIAETIPIWPAAHCCYA